MNNVVLIGRLTRDPELKYLPNGTANSTFTLAIDRGLTRDQKEQCEANGKPTTDFIRIVVWGKQAENVANYLSKGRLVGVQGRIQTGSYEGKNGKVYTTDIVANNVEFLERGNKQEGIPDGFTEADNGDIPF